MIYIEEKGVYQIDCSYAIWSTDQMQNDYRNAKVQLSDVDFIAETANNIYLVEYKNGNIDAAIAHGANFDPSEDKIKVKIAKKFYDSIHYLMVKNKNKPIKYIFIVEYPNADVTTRKMLREEISRKLPFKLQANQPGQLINDFEVLSIDEWNSHEEYSKLPLTPINNS